MNRKLTGFRSGAGSRARGGEALVRAMHLSRDVPVGRGGGTGARARCGKREAEGAVWEARAGAGAGGVLGLGRRIVPSVGRKRWLPICGCLANAKSGTCKSTLSVSRQPGPSAPGVPSSSCGYSGVTQDANLMSLDDIGR